MQAEKILIIEDEKKISDIVKSYLEREGFNVTAAETGEKALKLKIQDPNKRLKNIPRKKE
jgi:two-component system OmpR family response regulator